MSGDQNELPVSVSFTARKAMEDLRAGVALDQKLIDLLHEKRHMSCLRKEARDADLPLLLKLAGDDDEYVHKLAVGILQPWESRPEVKALFFELWNKWKGPYPRINLMFRILDYEDLTPEWHSELYHYIRVPENWKAFLNTQVGYMGEGSSYEGKGKRREVLANVESSLVQCGLAAMSPLAPQSQNVVSTSGSVVMPKFPKTKAWAYYCSAMASEDYFGTLRLFDRFQHDNDSFAQGVVGDLREECKQKLREQSEPHHESWTARDEKLWNVLRCLHDTVSLGTSCSYRRGCGHHHRSIIEPSPQDQHGNATKSGKSSKQDVSGGNAADRKFDDLLKRLAELDPHDRTDRGEIDKIVLESLEEWRWYSNQAARLAEDGALAVAFVMKEWSLRFGCLYRMLHYYPTTNQDWYAGSKADPCTSDLPVPCVAVASEKLVSDLPKALSAHGGGKEIGGRFGNFPEKFSEELCKTLRVVQWEVMPRDLFAEKEKRQLRQVPRVEMYLGRPGLLPDQEWGSLARAFWNQSVDEYYCTTDGMPVPPPKVSAAYLTALDDPKESISSRYRALFGREKGPEDLGSYSRFLRYIVAQHSERSQTQIILVQDGELTLYCILRRLRSRGSVQLSGDDLKELGLLCPVGDNGADRKWIVTRRLRSFVSWFFRVRKICMERFDSGDSVQSALERVAGVLPIRNAGDVDKSFLHKLVALFLSEYFAKGLTQIAATRVFSSAEEFSADLANAFASAHGGPETLKWIFSKDGEVGEAAYDSVLFEACRAPYLPAEDTIRSNQCCPMHLMIMPYDLRRIEPDLRDVYANAGIGEADLVPTAIAFATIIGEVDVMHGWKVGRPEWLHMYWSTFQAIASAIMIRANEDMAGELREHLALTNEYTRQGHEIKRVIKCIDYRVGEELLCFLRQYFYGVVLDQQLLKTPDRGKLPDVIADCAEASFQDYVNDLALYASEIAVLISYGGDDYAEITTTKARLEKAEEEVLRFEFDRALQTGKMIRINPTADLNLAAARAIYSAMLVALLVNIAKYAHRSYPVCVTLSGQTITFLNIVRPTEREGFLRAARGPRHLTYKFGGTAASLRSYLDRLKAVGMTFHEKIDLYPSQDCSMFYSQIPCPARLWTIGRTA